MDRRDEVEFGGAGCLWSVLLAIPAVLLWLGWSLVQVDDPTWPRIAGIVLIAAVVVGLGWLGWRGRGGE